MPRQSPKKRSASVTKTPPKSAKKKKTKQEIPTSPKKVAFSPLPKALPRRKPKAKTSKQRKRSASPRRVYYDDSEPSNTESEYTQFSEEGIRHRIFVPDIDGVDIRDVPTFADLKWAILYFSTFGLILGSSDLTSLTSSIDMDLMWDILANSCYAAGVLILSAYLGWLSMALMGLCISTGLLYGTTELLPHIPFLFAWVLFRYFKSARRSWRALSKNLDALAVASFALLENPHLILLAMTIQSMGFLYGNYVLSLAAYSRSLPEFFAYMFHMLWTIQFLMSLLEFTVARSLSKFWASQKDSTLVNRIADSFKSLLNGCVYSIGTLSGVSFLSSLGDFSTAGAIRLRDYLSSKRRSRLSRALFFIYDPSMVLLAFVSKHTSCTVVYASVDSTGLTDATDKGSKFMKRSSIYKNLRFDRVALYGGVIAFYGLSILINQGLLMALLQEVYGYHIRIFNYIFLGVPLSNAPGCPVDLSLFSYDAMLANFMFLGHWVTSLFTSPEFYTVCVELLLHSLVAYSFFRVLTTAMHTRAVLESRS